MRRSYEERWVIRGTIAEAVDAMHKRFAELAPRRAEFKRAELDPYHQVLAGDVISWTIELEYEAFDSEQDKP